MDDSLKRKSSKLLRDFSWCKHGNATGLCPECKHGNATGICPECQQRLDCGMADQTPVNNGGNASYYELPTGAKQLQDLLRDMTWNQANIMKAVYRWDKKPYLEYNLRKIIFFAQDELDLIYKAMKKEAMDNESE